ncbi:hypothetical protein DIURU_004412 [Diutina rugosa]|uniref:DUF155 domain-containing protein n=1 Tax=Diutina rugosa TaxID=5481 RepID=A0A642UHU0_DIURU|nr:uncharacterized protein DIURU_004412 [Diutina rugosa]KAA8899230.1 hypothetical protein DIURU_004412 [Diutina rugosa]
MGETSPPPIGGHGPHKPTAKRSPSILVTDSRQHAIKGARAPFAGHNFRKQQQQREAQSRQKPPKNHQNHTDNSGNSHSDGRETSPEAHSSSAGPQSAHHAPPLFSQSEHEGALHRRFGSIKNRYTDISVDKLLVNSSDIPSGQRRLPSLLASTKRIARGKLPLPASQPSAKRNIRSIPKLSSSLPQRTSKTSQKLVLIPEDASSSSDEEHSISELGESSQAITATPKRRADSTSPPMVQEIDRSRAELMSKEERAHEFSRTTAYFMCEEFNLLAVSKFLKQHHGVRPRLYEEALYVPYTLPLLPGTDGYRVKSNNSAKLLPKLRHMEKLITKTEQTNHLYEYYSGVETPEDAGNYSMDPGLNDTSAPFDPSEPQFFAPPNLTEPQEQTPSPSGSAPSQEAIPSTTTKKANTEVSVPPVPSVATPQSPQVEEPASSTRHHGEMFVFAYGIVVFWNFSETHEKNILADLAFADDDTMLINPIDEQDIETEEFHFDYDPSIHRPRIYNDMITLRSADHLIKLTMSHAIAQSTKLCLFESRVVNGLQSISKLPKKLALTGRLGLKRTQLLKKSGKIFKLKVDVNLSSSILDTPDFFWDLEPALHPLYTAVRDYLEIDQRVQVINDRCRVFLEFADIVTDSINEKNTNRVAWMLIIIIGLSLAVSTFEFVLEMSK